MVDYWQQLTDEQQRRDEEEMARDWMNWTAKEPPWWQIIEHRKWLQEQEDGLRHISTK